MAATAFAIERVQPKDLPDPSRGLDKATDDFVSSISHELRSPLTSTLGFLEMLKDGEGGTLTETQMHMVTVAERNGKRLLGLIEDLLTLSHVESGAFNVQFKPVMVDDLLEETLAPMKELASNRAVRLCVEKPEEDLGQLMCDQHQLTRAIENVVSNAIKFSHQDANSKVEVSIRRLGDKIELVVNDNGIGIPIDEQGRLFKRFFRSSVAVEQAYQGAGLGLSIARTVVEHHQGNIEIQSTLGVGTKATITLPAIPVGHTTATEKTESQNSLAF